MAKPSRQKKKRKKAKNPDTLNWSDRPQKDEVRFRKRNLRKQADRDAFGDSLVGDMQRAWNRQDWAEYDRIKAILYNVT